MIAFCAGLFLSLAVADQVSTLNNTAELGKFRGVGISCVRPPMTAKGALALSGFAVAGKVTSAAEDPQGGVRLHVHVYKTWEKGTPDKLHDIEITIPKGPSPHSDPYFRSGKEYLIYALKQGPGKYVRDLCPSRVLELQKASTDIKGLGRPTWIAPAKTLSEKAPSPSPSSQQ